MGISAAWQELGYRQSQNIKSIGTHTESHHAVIDILDMLDIAIKQSENGSSNQMVYFFSRIDGILNHLVSIGKIKSFRQAYIFRRKVMENLEIKNIDTHIQLYALLKSYPNHKIHMDIAISNIEMRTKEGKKILASIDTEWHEKDKKYFANTSLKTITQYRLIMKAYFFQKYGTDLSEKNKFAK